MKAGLDAGVTGVGSWATGKAAVRVAGLKGQRGGACLICGILPIVPWCDFWIGAVIYRWSWRAGGRERDVWPVKVQMRTPGGCGRTLDALADFAIVQSCLVTAAKASGESASPGAQTQLFTDGHWLPAAIRPG